MFDLATLEEDYGWLCKCVCKSPKRADDIVSRYLSIVRQMNGNGKLYCEKYAPSTVVLHTPDYDETIRIAVALNKILEKRLENS